jgi:hypothetical protein
MIIRLLLLVILLNFFAKQAMAQANQRTSTKAVKVELRRINDSYQLWRGGKPYYIKGAGGSQYLDRLAAYGGNSIRTWSTHKAQQTLDEAHKYGLTVTMGLDVARERHGFDYSNPQAVARQLEDLRAEVTKYKDHPALLIWGIGNELNLHYTNPAVWDAVNEIAQMIHEVDPNHLTSTMLAGLNKREVDLIKAKCPAIDILSVNTYGGLPKLPEQIRDFGWQGAYIVTEWGPTGHWESAQTAWQVAVEETSGAKAAVYKQRYEASMLQDKKNCIGSYVFLWGQKQERTPTWYGLFTEKGEETEVIDVMQYLWTGKWPANRAPHLESMQIDGKSVLENIYLLPKQRYTAIASVKDPDGDKLSYRWELLPESTDLKEGGDRENRPKAIEGLLQNKNNGQAILQAPTAEGAYRLFVYIADGKNKVATANIPFYVKAQ